MGRDEFHFFAPHLFSRNLGTSTKRDLHVRAEAEATKIRMGRFNLLKHDLWWRVEVNTHLRGRYGQALASPDVERHISPAPGIDIEFDRRERFDLRIGSYTRFLAIAAILAAHNI